MQRLEKTFYDVEHEGDIEQIVDIIIKNQGRIVYKKFNYDAEEVYIVFEVEDYKKFITQVRQDEDDAYWFS